MDGFEATRSIRQEGSKVLNRYVPIIAMTASVMSGDRESCLHAGMNDFIARLVRQKELEKMLVFWLSEDISDLDSRSSGKRSTLCDSQFCLAGLRKSERENSTVHGGLANSAGFAGVATRVTTG